MRYEGSSEKCSATCRGCAASAWDELRKPRNLGRLRYTRRRFSWFQGVAMRHEGSSEKVGQTASLPSLTEMPHRRNQGKLPVCPTLAPRFSFFQGVAMRHEAPAENPWVRIDTSVQ